MGGLVVGKEQDRAGHRAGHGRAGQGMAGQRGVSFFFFFFPIFVFKRISFQREEERFFFFVWVGSFPFSLFPSIEKKSCEANRYIGRYIDIIDIDVD